MQTQSKRMTKGRKRISFMSTARTLSALLMRIYRKLPSYSRTNTKPKSYAYYQSLHDIPLANWIRCLDGEIEYTRINGVGTPTRDEEAFCKINDEYLNRYGLNKAYKELLQVMKKKAEIQLKYVVTKDKFSLTLLEIEEENLKMMVMNNGQGVSMEQTLVHLSKFVGYWLRAKDITAGEYFTLLDEYKRINDIENGKKNK